MIAGCPLRRTAGIFQGDSEVIRATGRAKAEGATALLLLRLAVPVLSVLSIAILSVLSVAVLSVLSVAVLSILSGLSVAVLSILTRPVATTHL